MTTDAGTHDATTAVSRRVVERYNLELWNERRFELADELIADTMVRHEVDAVRILTRDQARDRAERMCAAVRDVRFTLLQVIADGEYVSIVYQCDMVTHEGEADAIASIEVFRVVDGRIAEVWNNEHTHGSWR